MSKATWYTAAGQQRGRLALVDTARALEKAEDFLVMLESSLRQDAQVDRGDDEEIRRVLPLIQKIANAVESNLGARMAPHSLMGEWPWSNARDATLRLIGILTSETEADEILAPVGPKLEATSLHPVVWDAAAKLWDDGHYRLAVQNAATMIDKHLQAKLDIVKPSGYELMTMVFSAKPKAGALVLRFREFDEGADDWTNAHQGAMAFAQGCVMRIRNLATHRPVEPDAQIALEHLAALSVLARWIDEGIVETAP